MKFPVPLHHQHHLTDCG